MTQTLPAHLPKAVTTAQQQHIVNIVRRAAKAEILPRFRNLNAADIATKSGPNDLVTEADIAAEAMITRALKIAFPDALIVGEEAVAADPSLQDALADAPLAFIIDPVDGTWNFAKGIGLFGVILAVTRYGRPAFGLIYDPLADDWAIADEDGPARLENGNGTSRPLQAAMGKPIENLVGFIPHQLFKGEKQQKLVACIPSFAQTNTLLCSAHEYRQIAQGHVDFVISSARPNPWDHAAGVLICQQAGGYAEMLAGGAYTADQNEGYLLTAPDKTTWNKLKKLLSFLLEDD